MKPYTLVFHHASDKTLCAVYSYEKLFDALKAFQQMHFLDPVNTSLYHGNTAVMMCASNNLLRFQEKPEIHYSNHQHNNDISVH